MSAVRPRSASADNEDLENAPSNGVQSTTQKTISHSVRMAIGRGHGLGAHRIAKSASKDKQMNTPDMYNPSPGNFNRKSDFFTAVINLVASIVGASALTIPYAFSQTGYILGAVLLIVCGLAADFSLYILCSCTRRSRTQSYAEVAKHVLGPIGGWLFTAILLGVLLFILTAYLILLRDIWSGLVEMFWELISGNGAFDLTDTEKNYVMIGCLIITLPACVQRDLHSLRHLCYVGFVSAIILALALTYRCVERNIENPVFIEQAVPYTTSFSQVLTAFPMLSLAFLCHFNMLSVHASLIDTSRKEMKSVINTSLAAGGLIYLVLGLSGYFYAYDSTQDDIILNFPSDDKVIFFGRLGLGLTLMVVVPMLALPSRNAFNDLISQLCELPVFSRPSTPNTLMAGVEKTKGGYSSLPVSEVNSAQSEREVALRRLWSTAKRVVTTIFLLLLCLYFATSLPGVGYVWSLCGSSLGFLVMFGFPALFYLRIRAKKAFNIRKLLAWVMMITTVVSSVLCTANVLNQS